MPSTCCQWCDMEFGAPSPIQWRADKGLVVKRRAPRSSECEGCLCALEVIYPEESSTATTKRELLKKVLEGEETKADFKTKLERYWANEQAACHSTFSLQHFCIADPMLKPSFCACSVFFEFLRYFSFSVFLYLH